MVDNDFGVCPVLQRHASLPMPSRQNHFHAEYFEIEVLPYQLAFFSLIAVVKAAAAAEDAVVVDKMVDSVYDEDSPQIHQTHLLSTMQHR